MRRFFARMGAFVFRARAEREMQREIDAHLTLLQDDFERRGMAPADAHIAARRVYGGVERAKDLHRDERSFVWAEQMLQDVRHAARGMVRSPGFTAAAILSLALGIGANTAIFSVVNALMLRSLPVSQPEQLVAPVIRIGDQTMPFAYWNYPAFELLRDHFVAASSTAAIAELDRSNVEIGDGVGLTPEAIHVALVSGNYFSTLGVTAAIGRTITATDDLVPDGHPVAVLSHAYWQRGLGSSSDALGHTLRVNSTTYTILGVMPVGFTGDRVGHPVDVWIPMAMQSEVMIEQPGLLRTPGPTWLRMISRLRSDTSLAAAESSVNALLFPPSDQPGISRRALSAADVTQLSQQKVLLESAARGFSRERAQLALPVTIVMAVVVLVLLVACANVTNLLLARAASRQTEIALRAALGAGRGRLVRQTLAESALLSACGGTLGLGLAAIGTPMLGGLLGSGSTDMSLDLHLDLRLLLFATGVSAATCLLVGMVPALSGSRGSLSSSLTRRGASGVRAPVRFRIGKTFVISQVALSLVLLIGAGLFVRTLSNLRTQPLGLDRSHVLVVRSAPAEQGLSGWAIAELMGQLSGRVASLPDVRAAAASSFAVLGGVGSGTRCTVDGYRYGANEDNFVRTNTVTPRYFEALDIPLVAGRDFGAGDDTSSRRVAVINETMARYYWGTPNVVGRRFGLARDIGNEIEVIGVVRDAKTEWVREPTERTVFLPYRQDGARLRSLALTIRVYGSGDRLRPQLRAVLRTAAPRLPISSIHTVDEQLDRMLVTERLVAALSGLFGVLALLLTCLGLFGVMSYLTVRRTSEIGVRLALGATRSGVLGLVLRESVGLVLAGLTIGVPVAVLVMRLARTALFGIGVTDAPTVALAALLLLVVAMAASLLPAHRAATVNPIVAIRSE